MSGSVDLNEHAREAEVAFRVRAGRSCERQLTAPWMLSLTAPPGEAQGALSYTFIPHSSGQHFAALSVELMEASAPMELRPAGWLSALVSGAGWKKINVLGAPMIVNDATLDAEALESDLNTHRVGLGELRVARIHNDVLQAEFLSPRPRSPSVIFERVEEIRAAFARARSQAVAASAAARPRRRFSAEAWAFMGNPLEAVTAPFTGIVSRTDDGVRTSVSLAGHVDDALTGELLLLPGGQIEAHLATPPLPTSVHLLPEQGVLGWLRSFREDTLGHRALDDSFLVHVQSDALNDFLISQAPPLLRLRDVGLQLELADGWMTVSGLVATTLEQTGGALSDLLELWRQLSLELVGLRN